MIDTKTLTCSNCHGGDFIRLDNNEFKCTHCGSITIVQDDVAERLEQILRKMQTSAVQPAAASATASRAGAWIIVAVVLVMLALFIANIGTNRSTRSTTSFSSPSFSLHERPAVDPGLLKIQDLHRASTGEKLVGMVRNDSDRVVTDVSLTVNVHQGPVRKDDRSTSMSQRLLPGESLPIVFDGWSPQKGESFGIASKEVRTDDDFNGRAQLQLKHEQLIRERDRLRFIGQLTNADALPAKSINVSINLLDGNGRLIGSGHGSPESSELARGEITNFDVSIDRYDDSDVASMQYVVDSERVKSGAGQ
jgi:hypothetical protein